MCVMWWRWSNAAILKCQNISAFDKCQSVQRVSVIAIVCGSFICSIMKRNYLNGSQKRQAAVDKKRKQDELLAKIPKLSSLFGTKNQNSAESSSGRSTETTSGVGNTLSRWSSSSSGSTNSCTADQAPRPPAEESDSAQSTEEEEQTQLSGILNRTWLSYNIIGQKTVSWVYLVSKTALSAIVFMSPI